MDEKNPLYKDAHGLNYEDKKRNILSIYNHGKVNGGGLRYAGRVLKNYEKWKSEFSD